MVIAVYLFAWTGNIGSIGKDGIVKPFRGGGLVTGEAEVVDG